MTSKEFEKAVVKRLDNIEKKRLGNIEKLVKANLELIKATLEIARQLQVLNQNIERLIKKSGKK